MKNVAFYTIFSLLSFSLHAQTITIAQQGRATSIRGLSVVNNKIAWVSGSKGNVGITKDGGKTWVWQQLAGFEKSDFRDIEAFSDREAIIMSSGTPALVLKTIDGGISWQEKYRVADSVYFLDAMDFINRKHGFIMGDPINGKFLLMETKDAGETWQVINNAPEALKDEAAFAASGTCLSVKDSIMIVTGGSNSRIISSPISGFNWLAKPLPLTSGRPGMGAFSLAKGNNQTIIVGGDYTRDTVADSVAYILPQAKAAYQQNMPITGPAGYQSCVAYITDETFIATGTPGSNITTDGGKTWRKFDVTSYNVCRKAKRGNLVLLAGNGGKIGIYNFSN